MEVPEELAKKYIERRKHDLENCVDSFYDGNYEDLEKIGHQLKGNGETFGYPEISSIGKRLEIAAQRRDKKTIELLLMEFNSWSEKINLNSSL